MTDSHLSASVGSSNGSSLVSSDWNITGSGPWLLAFMLTAIIFMTVCGNILLIALVFAHRSLRCTSNCFLVSLFFSDLMVALVVMPPAMLNMLCGSWVLWPAFCPVWLCFDVMCCSASILNLCVISLDRYLFIISPLRYKQRMTPPRALLLVGAAWSLAALASFLPIKMNWHSLGHGDENSLIPQVSLGNISSFHEKQYPDSYFQQSPMGGASFQCRLRVTLPFALVASVLTFFLPSSAICFTYCRILLAARRQAKRVAALSHPPHPHPSFGEPSRPPSPRVAAGSIQQVGCDCGHQGPAMSQNALLSVTSERRLAHKQGRRALKASLTLGVLLGLFFSAWLPFFITNMAQAVCECVPLALFDAITWLGYCNSTINPIIYPLFMRDFKRALAKLLPCCSSRSPRRPSPALSISLRNSGEPNMASNPTSPLASDPAHPAVTATDGVNLLDAEHAGIELPLLLPNQVDNLD
ncbi:5-hydroxytryptamine receptor 6 [Poecilia reticulata]|uniref:5-hydroxytryptamine receptor 6 n=1 Tax=Poecilia reticulata TaxID=8081 RepID=A0A3P9P763_POERE|nr:PREDICTED: 5-hydroxytryptamine receptor 6 [Poecilia reticulata]XP_017161444.1 PREDICTED: 5-hydroxytryptamine receptor 6 [Poecilia reticulata]XP_017161445.1 PREDICTED: 5-hydroxytryptamine receptor 6 [Poecilia reticulata]